MDASQRTAGIAFLCIGAVFGVAASVLAIAQHATGQALLAAGAGAVTSLGITATYWRTALERSGFYGVSRKDAAHAAIRPAGSSQKLVGAGAAIGATVGPLALVIAGFMLGLTPLAVLACLAGFLGAMSLVAGTVHFGFLVAAEVKWRLRDGA